MLHVRTRAVARSSLPGHTRVACTGTDGRARGPRAQVWDIYKLWCRAKGQSTSIAVFTLATINKPRNTSDNYPMLHAKAANCKHLMPFIAELAINAAEEASTIYSRTRAACAWSIAAYHATLDGADRILTADETEKVCKLARDFLDTYQALSRMSIDEHRRQWHIVKKHHYFVHSIIDIRRTRKNPRFFTCYADEDFVGRIAAVTRRLHRKTVANRCLARYLDRLRVRRPACQKLMRAHVVSSCARGDGVRVSHAGSRRSSDARARVTLVSTTLRASCIRRHPARWERLNAAPVRL